MTYKKDSMRNTPTLTLKKEEINAGLAVRKMKITINHTLSFPTGHKFCRTSDSVLAERRALPIALPLHSRN